MADAPKVVRGTLAGSTVQMSEETAKLLGSDFQPENSSDAEGYDSFKVADLKAEIERRNEGREDADLLSLEGNKADLVATLEADDNK